MKKLENFSNCLAVLKTADFALADNNEIYRTGIIGQFNLTFESFGACHRIPLKNAVQRNADRDFVALNSNNCNKQIILQSLDFPCILREGQYQNGGRLALFL